MEIITPIIFLLAIVLMLTAILLLAKTFLVSSGKVKITINGDKVIEVDGGSTLLTTLEMKEYFYLQLVVVVVLVFSVLVK